MSDILIVSIDLKRLAANLSTSLGRPVTRGEAEAWLRENGSGPHWLAEASVAAMLENGEIIGARPLESADEPLVPVDFGEGYSVPPYVLSQEHRELLSRMPGYGE